ncbi:hypothetical protein GXN76_13185 [Kroppenstedtia pulmonis]|uniref:Teneurin-like YD-shell domain-containing protein n=1 Tax=Kroppenstedtia pulmonis TaxID=1380685 RepID=A0A7D4BX75_9BACL|nr:RHS repeat-associated core domain-containing protein [Kroppenstedtia pulmonis]QKG85333.1 hypothetical protein GXN76_13185 [Kroppenstedtia pulmonis]
MTRGETTYYYQTNYRGDVTSLTDSTGAVVATNEYDAFGNLLKETGTVENPYRYAGYRYDDATGLYYLQSRYYNPDTGRFLTRDGFGGFSNEPLGLNKYGYVFNNPVIKIDPDGHWYFVVPWVVRGAIWGYRTYRIYRAGRTVMKFAKGGKQRVRDSGLAHLSNKEISRQAKNKSLSKKERARYQKEEKARTQRNKQKRKK